jgi:hypothetical protein
MPGPVITNLPERDCAHLSGGSPCCCTALECRPGRPRTGPGLHRLLASLLQLLRISQHNTAINIALNGSSIRNTQGNGVRSHRGA